MSAALKSIHNKKSVSNFDAAVYKKTVEYLQGRELPNARDLEDGVIGGILTEKGAINKIKNFLKPDHFYDSKNKEIYIGLLEMQERNLDIDILTVTEYFKAKTVVDYDTSEAKAKKVKVSLLKKIGGPLQIVEFSNKIISSANIEAHARIIECKYFERELIFKAFKVLEDSQNFALFDVINYRNDLSIDLRLDSQDAYLQIRDMNQVMQDAEVQPEQHMMVGPLWLKGQVAIFYGESGNGKSILAYQIGEALASGIGIFPKTLMNECERQRVLYFDFELSDRQLYKRYANTDTKVAFQFDENFIRASVNRNFVDYRSNMDSFVIGQIEEAIIKYEPEVIIVDNITYIATESTDPSVAIKIMKQIKTLNNKYNLSTLVMGHTPKRDNTQPISQNDLAGSKNLVNFCDTMFAIGSDCNDKTFKYIKQTKFRDVEEFFNEMNVIRTTIDRDSDMFLKHRFIHITREDSMLLKIYDDETESELIAEAADLRVKQGMSWRQLEAHYNGRWSHSTIRYKVTKYIKEDDLSGLEEQEKKNKKGVANDDPPF